MTSTAYICNRLNNRRRYLDMPLKELSRRAKVSPSTVQRVLSGEPGAAIESVVAIGDAMGIPALDFSQARGVGRMRTEQAIKKARRLVGLAQGTMALEAQAVDEATRKHVERTMVHRLLVGPRAKLWTTI